MAYIAPLGNAVNFNFTTGVYTPPVGNAIVFAFVPDVYIHLQALSLTHSTASFSVVPGATVLNMSSLSLSSIEDTSQIIPGSTSIYPNGLQDTIEVETILVGRGLHIHTIDTYLSIEPLSVVPGSIAVHMNSLATSLIAPKVISVIFVRLNSLSCITSNRVFTVVPGPIGIPVNAISGSVSFAVLDRVYLPIKGLGKIDIQAYYPETISNTINNGGPLSNRRVKNVNSSIFPPVTKEEKITGSILYRKVFWRNVNAENSNLLSGIVYLDKQFNDELLITILPCGYDDTQASVVQGVREYGTGLLTTAINIGSTSITVTLKDASLNIFNSGDTIVLAQGILSERFDNIIVVSKIGAVVTITLNRPTKYNYSIGSIISSCIRLSTLSGFGSKPNITSTLGTYNSSFPIEVFGNGGVRQSWTLTFTSESTFTCAGNKIGFLQNGNIHSHYAPLNPYTGTPYFVIDRRLWEGVYQSGDIARFGTSIAATAIWAKRIVPTNSTTNLSVFSCAIQGVM